MNLKNSLKLYLLEIPNFLSLAISPFLLLALSPMLIEISKLLNVKTEDLNLIFTYYTIGGIIGILTSALFNRKFKRLQVLISGLSLMILIIVLLVLSKNIFIFYILYFLAGYLLGVIWIQAFEGLLISKIKNKARVITVAFSFYSLGAVIAPLLSSVIINNHLNWRFVYLSSFLLITLIIIFYLTFNKNKKYYVKLENEQKYFLKEIFTYSTTNRLFLLTGISLFIFSIAFTVIYTWGPTFYRTERSFNIYSASLIVSIYYLTNFIGRIAISLMVGKIKINILLIIVYSVAFISFIFMIFSENKNIIFISLIVAGLSCSVIMPTLIYSGSSIFNTSRTVIIPILTVLGDIGAFIAPYLINFTIKYSQMNPMILIIIFMGIALIIIIVRSIYSKYLT